MSPLYEVRRIGEIDDAVAVSANAETACVLRNTGKVSCWGDWDRASVPFVANLLRGALFDVPLPASAVSVAVGAQSACAMLNTGKVMCWGNNSLGQCGVSNSNSSIADRVVVPLPTVKNFVLSGAVGCAIDNREYLWCWGFNEGGALGMGDTRERAGPVRIEKLEHVVEVYTYGGRVCAQTANGDVWCWGDDPRSAVNPLALHPVRKDAPQGQLSNVDFEFFTILAPNGDVHSVSLETSLSEQIPNLPPVQMMSGRFGAYCAILLNGEIRCWGDNTYGQLILSQSTAGRLRGD